jgi:malonyl-CoA O-methyltransferase
MQIKDLVINNFSSQAVVYDHHADVQVLAADELAKGLAQWRSDLAPGPILEIGCGTGCLSLSLLECFDDRQIVISDLSSSMLAACGQRIVQQFGRIPENVQLHLIDAETFEERSRFAAIISSFTLQWLTDLDGAIMRLINSLRPGGMFFFAVPSNQSFPEWKELCLQAGVPFTGNPLPPLSFFTELARRSDCSKLLRQKPITCSYPGMFAFLRCLKALGAATPINGNHLTIKQLLRLIDHSNKTNPSGLFLTYEVIFGKITKR